MKVNRRGKPLLVAEGSHFDHFDPTVDAFRRAKAYRQDDRVDEDDPQGFIDGPGSRCDRLKSAPCER